jgi:hypothetical protein
MRCCSFKYCVEYAAKARPQGHTIVFGFSWTLRIPKPTCQTLRQSIPLLDRSSDPVEDNWRNQIARFDHGERYADVTTAIAAKTDLKPASRPEKE